MNKDIAKVGDMVEYNGHIPENSWSQDRKYIEHMLTVGEQYEIDVVYHFNDGIGYKVVLERGTTSRVWAPIESFGIIKINMNEKYGLK